MKKIICLTALGLLLSTSAFAEIISETESFAGNLLKYPTVFLPKKAIAEKINKKIAESVFHLKQQHASLKGSADKISMSYEVLLENRSRLNLLLYSWTYNNGAAHGEYYTEGLSYDLTNGKRITADKIIGTPSPSELDSGIREGRYKLTSSDNKPLALTDFWKVEYVSKECLLNKDDSLTLVYQIYDLAPYAMGNTYVTIPKEYFPQLSGKEIKPLSEKQLAKRSLAEQKAQQKQEQLAAKMQAKEAQQQQKLMSKQSKNYEKQVKQEEQHQLKQKKFAEKAELAQIKAEQKAAMTKLKTEQKAKLEEYKAKHAKPKTKVK